MSQSLSLSFEELGNTIAEARLGVLHSFQAEGNVSKLKALDILSPPPAQNHSSLH